jgi:hypothetical protein
MTEREALHFDVIEVADISGAGDYRQCGCEKYARAELIPSIHGRWAVSPWGVSRAVERGKKQYTMDTSPLYSDGRNPVTAVWRRKFLANRDEVGIAVDPPAERCQVDLVGGQMVDILGPAAGFLYPGGNRVSVRPDVVSRGPGSQRH